MDKKLIARSPAKLILSGEHAVVYGQPAIAMAVNCYTETTISWHKAFVISFKLINLEYAKEHTLHTLNKLKTGLRENYCAFLKGKCNIRDVLKRPFELLQYSVTDLIENLNLQLTQGMEIQVNSDIPMGCGMGSSAAAIISTLYAIAHFFKLDLDQKKFLKLGQDAENLRHGYSSGLDLYVTTFGGSVKFQQGKTQPITMPKLPLFLANTGIPASTTGECIAQASHHFKSSKLALDFAAVTELLDQAINRNAIEDIKYAIRENHKLLQSIGVVPSNIAEFIVAIERQGGAAKICGAGSVTGEKGGIVMIIADHDVSQIAKRFGYRLQPVRVDYSGTKII